MNELSTIYSSEELNIIKLCSGNKFELLDTIESDCYILNTYGELTYQECFGIIPIENFFLKQRYNIARHKRIIKFYQYYIMEDENNCGEWFIGTKQKNGAIEFTNCCENLLYALESL
jgi:hypothetical protein